MCNIITVSDDTVLFKCALKVEFTCLRVHLHTHQGKHVR